MKCFVIVLLLFLLPINLIGGDLFHESAWNSTDGLWISKYDKVEHFIFGFYLDNVFLHTMKSKENSFAWSMMTHVILEFKDWLIPWNSKFALNLEKKIGYNVGGQGFDWKDAIMGMFAVVCNRILYYILN